MEMGGEVVEMGGRGGGELCMTGKVFQYHI